MYPPESRETAESGIGCTDNRHLRYLAASGIMNVGDSLKGGEQSTDELKRESEPP